MCADLELEDREHAAALRVGVLDETNYYSPVPDPGSYGSVTDALLAATVQMLHDPAKRAEGEFVPPAGPCPTPPTG
jgi:hypothetical protein